MKKIAIVFTILLVATTTFTKAQDVQPVNTPSTTVSKFNDIVEVNFNEISSEGNSLTMGFRNVFAYRVSTNFSVGAGIGLEARDNYGVEVPLSADFRYYINPTKYASPFVNLNGGYTVAGGGGYNANNVFTELNIGVNIIVTHDISLQMALGCKVESYGNLLTDRSGRFSADNFSLPFTIGLLF